MTIIGAYLSNQILQSWHLSETKTVLAELQSYGINTIFSEADTYDDKIIQQVHDMDMQFMGGLTCFQNNAVLQSQPELHPVAHDGQPRPKMNWYVGITPSFEVYAQSRLVALESMLKLHQLDGVWLDFVRWALHWEEELRDDTPPPLESSFDPHTLQRFAQYADIEIPAGTVAEQANWILSHHKPAWVDFKCQVISDFVRRARQLMQTYANDKPLGLDIVPAEKPTREHLLGQRLPDLAQHSDYLSPMLYHHILGKSPVWITDSLDQFSAEISTKLLPFVQVDALGKGDDTAGFTVSEWDTVLSATLHHPATVGVIAFTGDRLRQFGRGQQLHNVLSRPS